MQINQKIHVNRLASFNIELQKKLTYVLSLKPTIMGEAIQVCKKIMFQMKLKCL